MALALALDHPHAVSGLILVAPLTHPQRLLPLVFLSLAVRPAWLRRWLSHTLTMPIGLLTKGSVVKGVFAPDPAPADFATRGGGLLGMRPANFYAASTEINQVNDHLPGMVKRYPQLTLPIGLIYGAKDKVLDFRKHGQALASRVPGLKLQLVEGAAICCRSPRRSVLWRWWNRWPNGPDHRKTPPSCIHRWPWRTNNRAIRVAAQRRQCAL